MINHVRSRVPWWSQDKPKYVGHQHTEIRYQDIQKDMTIVTGVRHK